MNTLYDTADGRLAKGGQITRIRVERPADRGRTVARVSKDADANSAGGPVATLTYKGPPSSGGGAYKVREEHEVRVGNAEVLESICRLLGLRPWFRYEKYRSKYVLPGIKGVELDFDETPVGDYLELEGDRASIDRAAGLLGFSKDDYIVKSYGGLFVEALHFKPSRIRGEASAKNEPTPELRLPDMLFRQPKSRRNRSARRKVSKIKKI
jgi:adenylate cyclase class IV